MLEGMAEQRRRGRGQRGQATLEAVLVSGMILIPLLLGTVAVSQALHGWLVLQQAAAEGARLAGAAGGDLPEVRDGVARALGDGGLKASAVAVVVEPATVAWGEPVEVRLRMPMSIGLPFAPGLELTLQGAAVARGELNH